MDHYYLSSNSSNFISLILQLSLQIQIYSWSTLSFAASRRWRQFFGNNVSFIFSFFLFILSLPPLIYSSFVVISSFLSSVPHQVCTKSIRHQLHRSRTRFTTIDLHQLHDFHDLNNRYERFMSNTLEPMFCLHQIHDVVEFVGAQIHGTASRFEQPL
ncbi:hypothetical protein AAZX31_01G109200 [Glycine max]